MEADRIQLDVSSEKCPDIKQWFDFIFTWDVMIQIYCSTMLKQTQVTGENDNS